MTLLDFIRARLAEDEASDWPHRPMCQMFGPVPEGWVGPLLGNSFSCNCDAATRWIAEIEIKRQILNKIVPRIRAMADDAMYSDKNGDADNLLSLLALPYANHPNYDESWRP